MPDLRAPVDLHYDLYDGLRSSTYLTCRPLSVTPGITSAPDATVCDLSLQAIISPYRIPNWLSLHDNDGSRGCAEMPLLYNPVVWIRWGLEEDCNHCNVMMVWRVQSVKDTYLVIVETPAPHVGKNSPIEVRITFLKKFINQSFVICIFCWSASCWSGWSCNAKCQVPVT